jgi:hypothetical protein
MQRCLFSRTWRHFPHIIFQYFFPKKNSFSSQSIFYKFYYFPKFSFSSQNLLLLSILQHIKASKSNHINTMLPNEMVLAPLQKLKIKYELSYQSTTRLIYLLINLANCWSSTSERLRLIALRSWIHFTIFIWY